MGNHRSELVFLFGDPVDDNPTGAMMEAGFKALGLDFRYITARVGAAALPAALEGARAMGARGLNFTMPCKTAAASLMDRLTPAARIIGAINTCVIEDGALVGDNTDGKGFVQALARRGLSLEGRRLLVLGAGGAAKAIAVESALAGASRITVANRTFQKARDLAAVVGSCAGAEAQAIPWTPGLQVPADVDLLINATSVGLAPDSLSKPDLDYSSIRPGMAVCDVVFCPAPSLFLREAAKRGAITIDGLGMLVCQGLLAFELWTGAKAPREAIASALAAELA